MTKLITVHGTNGGADQDEGEMWWQRGSSFQKKLADLIDLRNVDVVHFHWDVGANSETELRRAGWRLYQQLRGYDEAGQDYYLVAHSHGGSVIYNALVYSARRGKRLARLQAWCTIGSPFIDLAPKRFLFSRLDAPGLAVYLLALTLVLAAAGAFMSFLAGTEISNAIDEQLRGQSLTHLYVPLLGGACMLALATYVLTIVYDRVRNRWITDREKRKVAELYSGAWIGLLHSDDEAIASLRAVTEFKPQIVPRTILVEPFSMIPALLVAAGMSWLIYALEMWLLRPLSTQQKVPKPHLSEFVLRPFSITDAVPPLPAFVSWFILVLVVLLLTTGFVWLCRLVGSIMGRPVAALIDRIVWASVRQQMWGDDLPAEFVRGVSSHPPLFGERYKPLPPSVAAPIAELSNSAAYETLRKLRGNLGMAASRSKDGDFLSDALAQLSWKELIHAAYFQTDEFARLLAFQLHRQGLSALRTENWTPEQRNAVRDADLQMTIPLAALGGELK